MLDNFDIQIRRSIGAIKVIRDIADQLEITNILGKHLESKVVMLLVAKRLIQPSDFYPLENWCKTQEILSVFNFSSDILPLNYFIKAQRFLVDKQQQIESHLISRYSKNQTEFVFKDVTHYYLKNNPNLSFEYEVLPDEKNVEDFIVGLYCDLNEYPLAIRILKLKDLNLKESLEKIHSEVRNLGLTQLKYIKGNKAWIHNTSVRNPQYSIQKKHLTKSIHKYRINYNHVSLQGHVLICMLASLIEREFEKQTSSINLSTIEKFYILDKVMTINIIKGTKLVYKCAKSTVDADNILKTLNIQLPDIL
jgi:hypothetical protein